MGRDGGNIADLIAGLEGNRLLFDAGYQGLAAFIKTTLEQHRVRAGGYQLQALIDNRLGKHSRRRGTVTSNIVGLNSGLLKQLHAKVRERILQLNLLRYAHTVVGDGWRTPFFIEGNIAATGAERRFDC